MMRKREREIKNEINPCEWEDLMYEIDTMPEYERAQAATKKVAI